MKTEEQKRGIFYSLFDHTADLGILVTAPTRRELFRRVGLALFDQLTDQSRICSREEKTFSVAGIDSADLLINYLRALLQLFSSEHFLVSRILVLQWRPQALTCRVSGEAYAAGRHDILTEIKAVTYHAAEIVPCPDGWQARFVLDV